MESRLVRFLEDKGLSLTHIGVLKDNAVDGYTFGLLLESDVDKMFPKVGVACRLKYLQQLWIKSQDDSNCLEYSDSTMPIDESQSEVSSGIDDEAPQLRRENALYVNSQLAQVIVQDDTMTDPSGYCELDTNPDTSKDSQLSTSMPEKSEFSRRLPQKLRHIRWERKKRLRTGPSGPDRLHRPLQIYRNYQLKKPV